MSKNTEIFASSSFVDQVAGLDHVELFTPPTTGLYRLTGVAVITYIYDPENGNGSIRDAYAAYTDGLTDFEITSAEELQVWESANEMGEYKVPLSIMICAKAGVPVTLTAIYETDTPETPMRWSAFVSVEKL